MTNLVTNDNVYYCITKHTILNVECSLYVNRINNDTIQLLRILVSLLTIR